MTKKRKYRKKRKFDIWDILLIFLLLGTFIGAIITTIMRTKEGYFDSGNIIALNIVFWTTFDAIFLGTVVNFIVRKAQK